MKNGGVNRISLGVQAAQDELLRNIGRIHTFRQACEAVEMVHEAGIHNVNTDLMYGLPGQTMDHYLDSIRAVERLGVDHISAYSLIL